MPDDDTPPVGPPAPAPNVKTVHNVVLGIASQVAAARNDIDTLDFRQREIQATLEALRRSGSFSAPNFSTPLPTPTIQSVPPPSEPLSTEPRPSMAVQAARKGLDVGKYTAIVLGVLTVLSQVAAQFSPRYGGAITAILKLFTGEP